MEKMSQYMGLFGAVLGIIWSLGETVMCIESGNDAWVGFFIMLLLSVFWLSVALEELREDE